MFQSSACYLDLGQESVHNAGYTGLPPTYTCLPHVMASQADSASTRYLPAPRHGHSGRFSLHQVLACPTSWPLRQIQPRPGTCLPHVMATQTDSASTRYLPVPRHGHSGRFSLHQVLSCSTSWPLRQIQTRPGTCLSHVLATQADSASTRYLPAPGHDHSGRFSLNQVLACPTSWPLRQIQPPPGTFIILFWSPNWHRMDSLDD